MFVGELEGGGWEFSGTEGELRDLILTIQDAIDEGEAEGTILLEDGATTLAVNCIAPEPPPS